MPQSTPTMARTTHRVCVLFSPRARARFSLRKYHITSRPGISSANPPNRKNKKNCSRKPPSSPLTSSGTLSALSKQTSASNSPPPSQTYGLSSRSMLLKRPTPSTRAVPRSLKRTLTPRSYASSSRSTHPVPYPTYLICRSDPS